MPAKSELPWSGSTFLTASHINTVAAAGGMMVAGGEKIYVVERGAARAREREFPEGWVDAVAVAPHGTRYAAATATYLHLYEGDDSIHFLIPDEDDEFQSIVWGFYGGRMALYAATANGVLYTVDVEDRALDRFDHDPTLKVCADANGRVALLDAEDEGIYGCWIFDEGGNEAPWVVFPEELMSLEAVALAGEALAVAAHDRIWVRRASQDKLVALDGILPEHAYVQAMQFAGAANDAPLLVAYKSGDHAHIVRADVRGELTTLADMSSRDGQPPQLSGIAWDDSNETLWAAWYNVGVTFSRRGVAKQLS